MKRTNCLFLRTNLATLLALCPSLVSPSVEAEQSLAAEILNSTALPERLIAVSQSLPQDSETEPLKIALSATSEAISVTDQLEILERFCASNPHSPWTPSLRVNLAKCYRDRGRFSLSLEHLEAAWQVVRGAQTNGAKKVGDTVLAYWVDLLVALGKRERLDELFSEVGNRTLDGGHLQQIFNAAQEAYGRMRGSPRQSFRCGIAALSAVGRFMKPNDGALNNLANELANDDGLSLADLNRLATVYGLDLKAVERSSVDEPVVPSIVHYRVGHFAAILGQKANRYLVADPAFPQPRWIQKADILGESSGYFLIQNPTQTPGSRVLERAEADQIRGRGYPNTIPDALDEYQALGQGVGLPSWRVSEPFINLWIQSAVIRYPLAGGRVQAMDLTFKQRNTRSSSASFDFGPSWESSWISYVDYYVEYDSESHQWGHSFLSAFMPLGGVRAYTADGSTPEYYSQSTLTEQSSPSSSNAVWIVNYPDGSLLRYDAQQDLGLGYRRAYLRYIKDPAGRYTQWGYVTTNSIVRMTELKDIESRKCILLYENTNALGRVTAVVDPYARTNRFYYNGSGQLTNIVNPDNFGGTFAYDSQGIITNLATPYGATAFKYTVNTNAGNVVNRSMEITEATGAKHLCIYRDQSTKLNSSSTNDLIPFSYPTNEVPDTGGLANTFDNTWMDARNSFNWGPRVYKKLSSPFQSTGNFDNLTINDYKLARLSHWLREPGTNVQGTLSATLSMHRLPSLDGTAEGQKTWFDYWGKTSVVGTNYSGQTVTNWYSRGSLPMPKFVALRLPDGTTRFSYTEYNFKANPTKVVSTWNNGSSVEARTNTFTYATGGIDLIRAYDAAGTLVVSNAWSTNHQITATYNALNEATRYTYTPDSLGLLASVTLPNGLVTTNYYNSSGQTNFLEKSVVLGMGITNSYTYTNALVLTHTDERGLTVTNTWDKLQRLIAVSRPDGTLTSTYTNLSLIQVVDRMGFTNKFGYDAFGRRISEIDPLNRTTSYSHCDCGAIEAVTNALNQATHYIYDNLGRVITTIQPDGLGATNIYNSVGLLVTVIHPTGYSMTNYYNNQGLLVAVSNVLGQVSRFSYDILDRATNSTDANGISVSAAYDMLGRLVKRTHPDGGEEKFGYTLNVPGLTAYTNQLTNVVLYSYDLGGRKTNESFLTVTTNKFTYDASGNLLTLTDGKNQTMRWGYDLYGRVTSKTNQTAGEVFRYAYDSNNRLTNRWSAQKGNTVYRYDSVGNLTNVDYAITPDVLFGFDPLNRVTNLVDAVGTTSYTYGSIGQLLTEDGPWTNDSVSYTFTSRRLTGLNLDQPSASPWTQSYGYDSVARLTNILSPAGAFGYNFNSGQSATPASLLRKLTLPSGSYITNSFDNVGRVVSTLLRNSQDVNLNVHSYIYDVGGQPTRQTRADGSYVDYTYDAIGQLLMAKGKELGGTTNRLHEQFSYGYDAAGNLNYRTNNNLAQTFVVNNRNELTNVTRSGAMTVAGTTTSTATNVSVNGLTAALYGDKTFSKDGFTLADGNNTFTAIGSDSLGRKDTNSVTINLPATVGFQYDLNGNLTSDGRRGFDYDDENQLIRVTVTNSWKSEFTYDGKMRRRIRKEFIWQNSAWLLIDEVRYIYDGNLVIQERDGNNLPLVTYTRGPDLSGTSQGAGGIGGLLARTDNGLLAIGSPSAHAYYHCDGNGNVTCLIGSNQLVTAKYLYDPFGNILSATGPLAEANLYRFSSKEYHGNSGLVYYLRRYYEPNLQRWINTDPIGEKGGYNLYGFAANTPTVQFDSWGNDTYYKLTDRTRDRITGWLNEIADRQRQGWSVIVINSPFTQTELGAYERLARGLPPLRLRPPRTLAQAFRQDLPPVLGVPLSGVAQLLGGLGTVARGIFSWNGQTIANGFSNAALGGLGAIGLTERIFDLGSVSTEATREFVRLREEARLEGLDSRVNDEKFGHANNAYYYQNALGPLTAPILALVGAGYELYHIFVPGHIPGQGYDYTRNSPFYGFFDGQHPVNWLWDTPGDFTANILGQGAGLFMPPSAYAGRGIRWAFVIPGPNYSNCNWSDLAPPGLACPYR